jgi:hypothetical protein
VSNLGDFGDAIISAFKTALGVDIVPGLLVGPIEDREMGSVLVHRVRESPGRVNEQQVIVTLRLFKRYQMVTDPTKPYDPKPLYNWVEELETIIYANQTGLAVGVWFQRITDFEVDPMQQGIEANLLAFRENPGTGGG